MQNRFAGFRTRFREETSASAFRPSLTKRIPRNGYTSPSGIVMPSWFRASTPSASVLAAGLVNRRNRAIRQHTRSNHDGVRRWPSRAPAGPPPITNTSTGFGKLLTIGFLSTTSYLQFSNNNPLTTSAKTNSEQNPGPIAAASRACPGSGRRFFMTSSSTTSTEADDKFASPSQALPGKRRAHHSSTSASAVASRILGPPVCSAQLPMSDRVNPRSARKSSRSRARFFSNRIRNFREREQCESPFPIRPNHHLFCVGINTERVARMFGSGKAAIGAATITAAAPSPNSRRNQVGH